MNDVILVGLKSFKKQKPLSLLILLLFVAIYTISLVIFSLTSNVPTVLHKEIEIFEERDNYFSVKQFLQLDDFDTLYETGVEHTKVYFYNGKSYIYNTCLTSNTIFVKKDSGLDAENNLVCAGQPIHYKEHIDVIKGESINKENQDGIWINEFMAQKLDVDVGQEITQYVFSSSKDNYLTINYPIIGITSTVISENGVSGYFNISLSNASKIYSFVENKDITGLYVYCSVYGIDNFISVIDELRSLDFVINSEIETVIRDNQSLINFINLFLMVMFIIVIFVSACILHNLNMFYIDNNKKILSMYKCLGAQNKTIIFMIMFKNTVINIVGLLIASVISLFVNEKITKKILDIFSFNIDVQYVWYYPVILIIFSMLILLFQIILLIRRFKKINLSLFHQEVE